MVRRAAGPLVVVLACNACAVGQDPLRDIGSANATPAVSQTPSAASTPPASPSTPADTPSPTSSTTQQAQPALPRGGREVFPNYRLVGYAGVTGAATLGRLGTGPLDQRVAEIERRAKPHAGRAGNLAGRGSDRHRCPGQSRQRWEVPDPPHRFPNCCLPQGCPEASGRAVAQSAARSLGVHY
jgi:hypothetical protein